MNTGINRVPPGHEPNPEESRRERLVVVAGPTAAGKTSLGVAIALACDGEVVNADSRYLYRGFDIGVAKPTARERNGVLHHLIDILPPDGDMSLARYQDLAMASISDILSRGKLPILVGGTPLYLNAVVEGWRIPRVPPNAAKRAEFEIAAAEFGVEALSERLRLVDPTSANRCGRNLRRIIRALEIFDATGVPMSAQVGKGLPPYATLELGLTCPRQELYRRIDERVSYQIALGLVAELRCLLDAGVPEDAHAMSSIGYRQLLPYLHGASTLEDATERIRHDTHRYVRHQETWLRKNPRLVPCDTFSSAWMAAAIARVRTFLAVTFSDADGEPRNG